MRGLAMLGLLAVLGFGAWLALSGTSTELHEAPPTGDGLDADPEERFTPDAAPQRAQVENPDRGPAKRSSNPDPKSNPARVAVTIRVLDRRGDEVDGFEVAVLNPTDASQPPRPLPPTRSGNTVALPVGAHLLQVRHPDFATPPRQTAEVTRDGPNEVVFQLGPRIGIVMLKVLDQTSKAPVARFRLTVTTRVPGQSPKTEVIPTPDSNPLRLECPVQGQLQIQVEGPGYTPAQPRSFRFDPLAPRREETVYLAAVMKFSGVEFRVTDRLSAPIPHLLVQTNRRDGGKFKRLWSRRKSAPDGVYKLPDLAPGDYQMLLVAVDSEGHATLHQARSYSCTITGNEHVIEPIQLLAGGNIELRARDTAGNQIGKGVNITLVKPDGNTVESIWQALTNGKPTPNVKLTADHLGQSSPARLYRALPPGDYTLKLSYQAGRVVARPVRIAGGRSTVVDVALTPGQ